MKYCKESNKPFGLNLSACFLIEFNTAQVLEAIEYADYVFCNEDEAACFAKIQKIEHTSLKDVAMDIAKSKKQNDKRQRVAIVTQGKDPVLVAACKEGSSEHSMIEIEVPALTKEQIVDTNGAGDAFVGGFLSQLSQDKDLETCCKAGIYCSSVIIQRSGCSFPDKCTF